MKKIKNYLKLYFKSKEFLLSITIIGILTILNICSYFINTITYDGLMDGVNCFSFWNYCLHYNLGSAVMFLSPILISILVLPNFFHKFFGSFLKSSLLRQKYLVLFLKELICSYFKAWFPFALTSLTLFVIGYIVLPHDITNIIYANQYTMFDYIGFNSPYTFVLFSFIQIFMYVIMVVNIGLIVLYFSKKILVSFIITFVTMNAINLIVGNVLIFIGQSLSNEKFLNYVYNVNVYEGYFVQSTMSRAIIHTSIYALITTIIIIIVYSNKERLVLNSE